MSQIIGLFGISYAIYFVVTHHVSSFQGYLDPHAIVLLSVMPPSVMILSHTVSDLWLGFRLLFSAIFSRQSKSQKEVIQVLMHTSQMVRAEGMGAIVKVRNIVRYELLKDGLSMVINDFSAEEIRHNLVAKIQARQTKMSIASNLFENMSKLCPGVGMIGTLIGLIRMLSNLSDPSQLGSGMAMAMVTTLYGLVLGTCVYGPWGEKIMMEADKISKNDMLVLEGILNIKNKKSSIHLQDIVKTYGSQNAAGKIATQPAQGRAS